MKPKKTITLEFVVLVLLASVWFVICLFPLWMIFSGTFSSDSTNLTQAYWPNDFANGLSKIKYALNTINVWRATLDTFIYTMIALAGMLVICSLAAYEFTFFRFPLKKFFFGLMMGTMMLPLTLYVIPLYRMVFKLGLADTYIGVALPIMISPLSVFIMKQFLEDLPLSFIESARIDGAGHFVIFGRIVFPLMRNGIITAVVLLFLKAWSSFLWPSLVTAQNIKPISVTIANLFNPQFYVDTRVRFGAMLLAMIPPLALYLIFQRFVIKGISMSGVKG
ncbi:carbohydrate ABC transporter permease [Breznakiella homolactica]|uniref:sn-glycerol-3-phosphate transport system permease protein UgpE n=1 Tax=Breznakiella homolactica TaxID=2798577 RepID=A0A7T8B991_9SPIR|nr:carbohydrate ABC transporter permease [Breznakiella homolactica]QQO07715.1 carbohydrate ABC transporter permease [Breznakiella homolactica]